MKDLKIFTELQKQVNYSRPMEPGYHSCLHGKDGEVCANTEVSVNWLTEWFVDNTYVLTSPSVPLELINCAAMVVRIFDVTG